MISDLWCSPFHSCVLHWQLRWWNLPPGQSPGQHSRQQWLLCEEHQAGRIWPPRNRNCRTRYICSHDRSRIILFFLNPISEFLAKNLCSVSFVINLLMYYKFIFLWFCLTQSDNRIAIFNIYTKRLLFHPLWLAGANLLASVLLPGRYLILSSWFQCRLWPKAESVSTLFLKRDQRFFYCHLLFFGYFFPISSAFLLCTPKRRVRLSACLRCLWEECSFLLKPR